MRLSTRGRYGVRAMLDLALNGEGGPVSLNSIAQRQNISLSYLEQIISMLRKAELVASMRGSQGGYVLTRHPKEITIGDILRILEGPLVLVDCVNKELELSCDHAPNCATRDIWSILSENINSALDEVSLHQLAQKQKELS